MIETACGILITLMLGAMLIHITYMHVKAMECRRRVNEFLKSNDMEGSQE